jgi:prepilin-type processing-associated H-X9-DG protein
MLIRRRRRGFKLIDLMGSSRGCRGPDEPASPLHQQLQPTARGMTGSGWQLANRPGGPESINGARTLRAKGSFPFLNSGHRGVVNVAMCDGSTKSLSETIDGEVYAKLITPAGTALPAMLRQSQPPYYETSP